MPSPTYPSIISDYEAFRSVPARQVDVLTSPVQVEGSPGEKVEVKYFGQTGEVVMTRGPEGQAPTSAMLLGRSSSEYDMVGLFAPKAIVDLGARRLSGEVTVRAVLGYFRELNGARRDGAAFDNAGPRVEPTGMLTREQHNQRLARRDIPPRVAELSRDLYASHLPGIEWKVMRDETGSVWAETVEGGPNAVVKTITSKAPRADILDEVIKNVDLWRGEPDGLNWLTSKVIAASAQSRGIMASPKGADIRLSAEMFGEGLVDVGPPLNRGAYKTQFRYEPISRSLYAFGLNPNDNTFNRDLESWATMVGIVEPDAIDHINRLGLTEDMGDAGVERVLYEATLSQIGMPPCERALQQTGPTIEF